MTDVFTKFERSRIMAAVKSKDTTPELLVRRLAHSMGYRYRLHVRSMPGCPDMVFPRLRKVINVNGCFWHLHGCAHCRIPSSHRHYWVNKLHRNVQRDEQVRRQLRRAGWKVLTVWECQTRIPNLARLQTKIVRFLETTVP
jgi:DNA mismatch endonuclease (patch repair protein)